MIQSLLTKYGVAFHAALICLVSFLLLLTGSDVGMPYVWLSLILLECSFWMPSVRMGEDFRDARKRYIRTLIGDPLFYVGIVVLILMIVEGINGGCTLKYLTDTDKWVMEDPSQPWLPFAVHVSDAFYWLTVFLAVFTVMLVARNALGSTARRYLLRTVALFSGFCAIGASIYALRLPVEDATAWFASQAGQTIGVIFLLWALVGLAVFADNEGRSGRHGFWFFAIGAFGNFFGMLIFAEPVVMTVGAVAFILVLIFSLTSLHKVVEQGDLLKYIVVGVIFIGAIGGSLFYASKDNPVTRKVKTFKDFESYAATYTSTRPERAKAAIAIFQGHPLCGVGVEGYGEFVGFFVKSDAEWKAFKVEKHFVMNDYLQLLAEGGAIGVTVALVTLVVLLIPLFVHQRVRMIQAQEAKRAVAGHTHGPSKESADPLSPVVVAGVLGTVLTALTAGVGAPFRHPALLISVALVLAELPTYLPSVKRISNTDSGKR